MGSITSQGGTHSRRIAILECGIPPPGAHARYGTFGAMFEALFIQNLGTGPSEFTSEIYHVYEDNAFYPDLENVDAILITGSKYDAYANTSWIHSLVAYTSNALKDPRIKIIGVCFGHQIIGRALGAKVCVNNLGWELGIVSIDLSPTGKALFDKDTLSLQLAHQDIVTSVPEGVLNIGTTPLCGVQGMYKYGKFITLQGHPEFDEATTREIIGNRHTRNAINKPMFSDAMERASLENEGILAGSLFRRFLLSDEL